MLNCIISGNLLLSVTGNFVRVGSEKLQLFDSYDTCLSLINEKVEELEQQNDREILSAVDYEQLHSWRHAEIWECSDEVCHKFL